MGIPARPQRIAAARTALGKCLLPCRMGIPARPEPLPAIQRATRTVRESDQHAQSNQRAPVRARAGMPKLHLFFTASPETGSAETVNQDG